MDSMTAQMTARERSSLKDLHEKTEMVDYGKEGKKENLKRRSASRFRTHLLLYLSSLCLAARDVSSAAAFIPGSLLEISLRGTGGFVSQSKSVRIPRVRFLVGLRSAAGGQGQGGEQVAKLMAPPRRPGFVDPVPETAQAPIPSTGNQVSAGNATMTVMEGYQARQGKELRAEAPIQKDSIIVDAARKTSKTKIEGHNSTSQKGWSASSNETVLPLQQEESVIKIGR